MSKPSRNVFDCRFVADRAASNENAGQNAACFAEGFKQRPVDDSTDFPKVGQDLPQEDEQEGSVENFTSSYEDLRHALQELDLGDDLRITTRVSSVHCAQTRLTDGCRRTRPLPQFRRKMSRGPNTTSSCFVTPGFVKLGSSHTSHSLTRPATTSSTPSLYDGLRAERYCFFQTLEHACGSTPDPRPTCCQSRTNSFKASRSFTSMV